MTTLNVIQLLKDAYPVIAKYKKEIRDTGDWFYYFKNYCINVYDQECAQKHGYTVYAYALRDDGTCDFMPEICKFNIRLRDFKNL